MIITTAKLSNEIINCVTTSGIVLNLYNLVSGVLYSHSCTDQDKMSSNMSLQQGKKYKKSTYQHLPVGNPADNEQYINNTHIQLERQLQ